MNKEIVPPNDVEAERALLACVLLDNAALARVTAASGDFYYPAHGVVIDAMRRLRSRETPIDVVTLARELLEMERLNTIGGAQYLGEITDGAVTTAHVDAYNDLVIGASTVRRMIELGHEMAARGYEFPADPGEYVGTFLRRMMQVASRSARRDLVPISRVIENVIDKLEKTAVSEHGVTGTSTGLRDLDGILSGLHPGQLVVVAGRPGMGKTALANTFTLAAARERKGSVLFFSVEMPRDEIVLRALATEAGIDQMHLRRVHLRAEEWERLNGAANALHGLDVQFEDSGICTPEDVHAQALRAMSRAPVSLIAIDYLQLMASRRHSESREREISEITRSMKVLAKELGVPVVLLSQLNRDCEQKPNKRPLLSNLRESGAIEQDADVVLFLYRDEVYTAASGDDARRGIAEIIIGKQRNGPTDTVCVGYQKESTRFFDLAPESREAYLTAIGDGGGAPKRRRRALAEERSGG